MGKRGPKPKNNIDTTWRPELAYVVGLLAADGCMSPAGHLIDLTSKDREQLENFSKCVGITNKIGRKRSGYNDGGVYLRVQFKSVRFYEFLGSVGLTPNKSHTIGSLAIPDEYFWDFLRGLYDGDGSSNAYWDPRWKSSYMFYTNFVSASPNFIVWLREEIEKRISMSGSMTGPSTCRVIQLKYAKDASREILRGMYYAENVTCLSRKKLKVEKILATVGERL
ncbi:hypothetical protein KTR10_01165 [Candidatus Kaiserbacteria bacterium]|nr:hypothetical protein [Candidatus Kaiserbacteria bacterium]